MDNLEEVYKLSEEELIKEIKSSGGGFYILCLLERYKNNPSELIKNELLSIENRIKNSLNTTINENLSKTIEHNLEHLLTVEIAELMKKYIGIENYVEYKKTEEFKYYNDCIAPIKHRIGDLGLPFIIKVVTSLDSNINQKKVLLESISLAEKYLKQIKVNFNLDINTVNCFTNNLLLHICSFTHAIFYIKDFIELDNYNNKNVKEQSKILELVVKADNEESINALKQELDILETNLQKVVSDYNKKVVGYNELKELALLCNKNNLFNFEEFKEVINLILDDSNNEQLIYFSMYISIWLAEKTGEVPSQNEFILNNLINPWSKELEELLQTNINKTNFNLEEAKEYINRLRIKGEYKSKRYKINALKRVFNLDNELNSVYTGDTAIIPQRPYMVNDCSKFKSSLYQFLMSDSENTKKDMELNKKSKSKKLDTREFYLMEKTGKATKALSIEHIALLIGLENVYMNCEEFIQTDGTIFLKKPDLMNLFGDNFRGEREEVFLKLVRDMSQILVKVDLLNASKNLTTGEVTQTKTGEIEGNLMSFFTMTNRHGDSIYQIKMPFLEELLKRSTRNTLKSIDLLKYTFKNPETILIAEYLSNIIFYHRKSNGTTPKKISIKSVLEQLGLYEKYKNMSAKDCNVYLLRLKKNIEVAGAMIRNVKNIKFTPLSKTKIDDKSCGFTVYFKNSNNENLKIEA